MLADNLLLMFVGWEGVGLCSYLLIGFLVPTAKFADNGTKAFVVNRIGDAGFLLGMFLLILSALTRVASTLNFAHLQPNRATLAPVETTGRRSCSCRRDRQVGADPALRLAAGRDGRPDAGRRR